MNLDQSLRELAEREPGKFEVWQRASLGGFSEFVWFVPDPFEVEGRVQRVVPITTLTSDDLDEIAALIGWEYEVLRRSKGEWEYSIIDSHDIGRSDGKPYKSKLEAAKAALAAIIRHHLKDYG